MTEINVSHVYYLLKDFASSMALLLLRAMDGMGSDWGKHLVEQLQEKCPTAPAGKTCNQPSQTIGVKKFL